MISLMITQMLLMVGWAKKKKTSSKVTNVRVIPLTGFFFKAIDGETENMYTFNALIIFT